MPTMQEVFDDLDRAVRQARQTEAALKSALWKAAALDLADERHAIEHLYADGHALAEQIIATRDWHFARHLRALDTPSPTAASEQPAAREGGSEGE